MASTGVPPNPGALTPADTSAPPPNQPGAHARRHRSSAAAGITDAVTAKDGEPFLLCGPDGQIPARGGHGLGFYHHDCRFLDGYELRLGGAKPETLAATEVGGNTLLLELTNPALGSQSDGERRVERDQLGITWTRRVDASGPALHDELEIRNFGDTDASIPVDLRFRATFEDVFQVRGLAGQGSGSLRQPAWHGGTLRFGYAGSDGVERGVSIRIRPEPDTFTSDGASLTLSIPGRKRTTLRVEVELSEKAGRGVQPVEERSSPHRQPRRNTDASHATAEDTADGEWIGGHGWTTSVRTSSFALRRALGRSLDDLALLRGQLGGLRYYEAGIPWFATVFGRDSLIAALQSLAFDADVAAETLRLLASRQGQTDDAWREEQPGRILHELRIGELARTDEIPQTPYFGTVDATPLFLMLLGRHETWTGSLDLFRELRGSVEAALGWIDRTAADDGDGFLTYRGRSANGLANQGWKDSGDAIVMADGSLAEPPIALAEVQGYVYRARLAIADLYERDGDAAAAASLRRAAAELRERFEARFWNEPLGCYALALANGSPCEVVTSNAGQVLWTGIAGEERAAKVAHRLMQPDMFGGWGIRTLSTEATAYHPIGYHLGTIWPHDNSLIADGFCRYGHREAAEAIFLGLLEAAGRLPHDRLPECLAGFGRDTFADPVRYPVACHPQAWAAGALPSLLITTLGIEPDGFAGVLRIRRPLLPRGIEEVELRDLPVGAGRAHLRFRRKADETLLEVVALDGGATVQAVQGPAARE